MMRGRATTTATTGTTIYTNGYSNNSHTAGLSGFSVNGIAATMSSTASTMATPSTPTKATTTATTTSNGYINGSNGTNYNATIGNSIYNMLASNSFASGNAHGSGNGHGANSTSSNSNNTNRKQQKQYLNIIVHLCCTDNWYAYAFISFVAIVSYLNGIHGDFVHDDIPAITQNKDVIGVNEMTKMFLNDFWGTPMSDTNSHKSYRPLTVLSFR